MNPASAVGKIAKSANIPYILDACQSVGQLSLNVEEIGCDILCSTGRKYLRGPRGTGLLYVRKGIIEQLEPPLLDQHAATLISPTSYKIRSDAKRFENWEQHLAGKAALGTAIDYALSYGLDSIQSRIYQLSKLLRTKLMDIAGVEITDEGLEKCGIVTFATTQLTPTAITLFLYKLSGF